MEMHRRVDHFSGSDICGLKVRVPHTMPYRNTVPLSAGDTALRFSKNYATGWLFGKIVCW